MVCRLGINHGKSPYVIPLSFGYHDHTLYFHSGAKGKKLDLLKNNPNVCFEVDNITKIMEAENPCACDIKYQSIVGFGKVEFIDDTQERIKALKAIISQYTDKHPNIPKFQAETTVVFKVIIKNMTYKQNPD